MLTAEWASNAVPRMTAMPNRVLLQQFAAQFYRREKSSTALPKNGWDVL